MDKYKEIRPIVLGLAVRDNKILVGEGYDAVKKQTFYRCLGGGIEFLETSEVALKREFMEELHADIEVGEFCGIKENIFTLEGKNAHELVLLYKIKIKDEDYKESYHIIDSSDHDAYWIDIDEFKSGKKILYPSVDILDML